MLLLFLMLISVLSENAFSAMTTLTLHGVTDELKNAYEKYSDALQTAGKAFKEVEEIFNDLNYDPKTGPWSVDTRGDGDDIVYAHKNVKPKMLTISTILEDDVDDVMRETWNGLDNLPTWNQNINFASTIARPTEHFDVITYGNNDVLIVSGRDFVSARVYRKTHDGYMMASRSVHLNDHPEKDGKVRAELMLAGARFRRHPDHSDKTLCDVVMQADLKGMLPRFVVNQVLGKIMLMDTVANRKHFAELKSQRASSKEKREIPQE